MYNNHILFIAWVTNSL